MVLDAGSRGSPQDVPFAAISVADWCAAIENGKEYRRSCSRKVEEGLVGTASGWIVCVAGGKRIHVVVTNVICAVSKVKINLQMSLFRKDPSQS